MIEAALTPDRILDAAEQVLRRFGPDKATVVDVARALAVSHGSVYRHFSSKTALRDAVAARWLARVSAPLAQVAGRPGPARKRLRQWLDRLIALKRKKAADDPELFETYVRIAAAAHGVIEAHVEHLVGQLASILADGAARGELTVADPDAAARAVFDATSRFHNPAHAGEWSDPGIDDAFERVWALLLSGLEAGSAAGATGPSSPRARLGTGRGAPAGRRSPRGRSQPRKR